MILPCGIGRIFKCSGVAVVCQHPSGYLFAVCPKCFRWRLLDEKEQEMYLENVIGGWD